MLLTTPPAGATEVAHSIPAAGNPVQLENAKPGTLGWLLQNPALGGEIEGFASASSVARGQPIDFLVSTEAQSYRIDVYRTGYYGGAGARLMASFDGLPGTRQKKPCLDARGVIECDWTASLRLSIPDGHAEPDGTDDWPSGVYLAKLTTDDAPRHDSYIIFVVRDDARHPTYVVQLPITTYEAYNLWGGKSLYMGCQLHDGRLRNCDPDARVDTVSFNRPFGININEAAKYGLGAGEYITNLQPVGEKYPISSASFDYNLVRWMERRGYDVGYITNLDLHENKELPDGIKAFIATGHDEYYSKPMWDHLVAAVDHGLNVGFFTANNIYWQVRFSEGEFGIGRHDRLMICYRKGGDPVRDNELTTGLFRNLGRPEASLIGSQYVFDPVQGDIRIVNPHHWLLAGTGATENAKLRGLLGYEVNAMSATSSPANLKILAHSSGRDYTSDVTYYIRPSSAQIFSTGTMQWSWGLDSFISNGLRTDYSSAIVDAITRNVFDALGERGLHAFANIAVQAYLRAAPQAARTVGVTLAAAGGDADKHVQWRIVATGGEGRFLLVSRAEGVCLGAVEGAGEDDLRAGDCNGSAGQQWQIIQRGASEVVLKEAAGTRCLEARPPHRASGSSIVAAPCRAEAREQLWRVSAPSS
jgi:hypothetical protein